MALEARAVERARAKGVNAERVVLLFLMERFLERLFQELGDDALTVKGGVALELRLERARSTRDLDLRTTGSPERLLDRLRAAGRRDLGDFLHFDAAETGDIGGDGVIDEGRRFQIQASLGGRRYRHAFGVDVVFAANVTRAPDHLPSLDTLGIIAAPRHLVPVYPLEAHLAEKVHAYTVPRPRPNSRLKDLVDMALLAGRALPAADTLRAALDETFAARGTHAVPTRLPEPPEAWHARYPAVARGNGFTWPTLGHVLAEARQLLDPLLAGATGHWDAPSRSWRD